MRIGTFPVDKFKELETPFYYYDMTLLKVTLNNIKEHSEKHNYIVHYAVKANSNKKLLETIAAAGFGADCVSGNEVKAAVLAGFPSSKVVFAGVGKTDKEIMTALDLNISCFNVESIPELEVINELAQKKGKTAPIAIRINPDVDAETHKYITTGKSDNKFGFNISQLDKTIELIKSLKHINFKGVHYHIGSQIVNMDVFERLCKRALELESYLLDKGIDVEHINLGGGLGVDYHNPNENLIPDFKAYFETFFNNLKETKKNIHFELGRSVIAQSGSLISRVTYIKEGENKTFAILDSGMTDLIRPALYQAYHKIDNLSSPSHEKMKYDIVGPICESTDSFAKDYAIASLKRGDIIAVRTAGAYGEVMSSRYNLRDLPKTYYSDSKE